jgi:hypothetical protein
MKKTPFASILNRCVLLGFAGVCAQTLSQTLPPTFAGSISAATICALTASAPCFAAIGQPERLLGRFGFLDRGLNIKVSKLRYVLLGLSGGLGLGCSISKRHLQ